MVVWGITPVLKRPALEKLPKRVSRAFAHTPVLHEMGSDAYQVR